MEKYDLESILEMYDDDYQKVAEVPRSEMDNFNTPDLEQAPDSYLKPGETLEDFDVTFRRPNAQGGSIRPGFYRGESVVKSHGQKLIDLTEAGESSVSIAKKLGLKQQTVSNALNAIDKGIAGDDYKLSKPLKDLQIPKNQYSGKLLTENTELIEAIKKDASKMSDKEIKAKYNIHKSTLKKIKDENDITTRSSYLPEGQQKKSIPYAERYTTEEKSAMYKKRKETETEEDRIKAKERRKKYDDKVYKDYKMEPSSKTFYDDLWKDIARSANEGNRIKLVEGPKYASGASYDDFKSRVFLDTKTGETFNYNNLKNYLDSGKLEGVTYDSVIKPYELKNKIANSGLREEIQKAYFGDKYQPPKRFRSQNTFHVHHIGGVAADPFSVQLTFADENLGLVSNKKFNTEWAKLIERNAPLSERKAYLKFVKKQIGDNISQTLEFPEVGKVRTYGEIGTDMQKLLSGDKFKKIQGIEKLIQDLQNVTSKGGSKGKAAAKALQIIAAGGIGFNMEDILKGTGLMDKEYELTASAADAPIVEKGLSTGEKIAAGTTGALGVGTKTGRKLLGKALNLGFGPTGILGINAYLGLDPTSGVDRAVAAGEAALLPSAVKGTLSVTDKIKNPLIRKTIERATLAGMSPAMALRFARVANPVGIATLVGEGLYQLGKKGYNQYQQMQGMTEQEKSAFLADQYENLGGVFGEGA